MYNATADRLMYAEIDVDDDLTPDSLLEGYRHQTTDPLTGLDDVLMETWLFEDEDTEFFEERPPARTFGMRSAG